MAQEVIKIRGGQTLKGSVEINGAKNSSVAIIPATLMAEAPVTLDGLPQISDVETLVSLLGDLNIKTELNGTTLVVDPTHIENAPLPNNKVESLRASYYMMGAMLGRFKKCVIGLPGGCPLGPRPIDQHIKGFKALGATVDESSLTSMKIEAERLVGANIYLDIVSVGATINIMLAATRAEGQTIIENAAKEPEVVDVANFLNSMGAKVTGAGTSSIKIVGVPHLHGSRHSIIPDRIEAGTYMCIAAACGESVHIDNIIPKHMEALTVKLKELGVTIETGDDYMIVQSFAPYKSVDIKTLVYPGFATDLQQPITPLLFLANGPSFVTETIYPERFRHVKELQKMNGLITADQNTATVKPSKLTGTEVYASDLRAGACLIVAGLLAEGVTTIYNVKHIYRGYTDIVKTLKALGADIWTEQVKA
ncbi:UDP-N-acetylglucosamine 1-carboxyvinyltransferase [Staphylococcus pseudintermedius]|uniref:UDP-N-acetylglucosamine 1-carboxyvinyltransferase n=1 Tax=Staphylococcus pseudintermedius TaxID=283734 RepID=UPI000D726475|nr:UDP-N-acetylglucosamine 1-carboxyvinyltransferase [Staphylococcus pseudintermedius]EGQ1275681.1 UDP-N-acetylglucosamine 1-carboxyvinyltransferase [Staphylococcus pseudintermedius]EGQ1721145.1 UDP-N-acetylglucosamine 1-carboxyvinyltransferase [Staphylococcus pseudintermedius]EGQ2672062.1 UDP-N-acetylglucosamine 1-carboxyvinyltransferase [Staphylococcus pseudintermedius]EGQ2724519.1 UDP-N-acetylglucosamine 1-carboxyvinyltransferase [Staphylococcus pseudintermedius]EGQ2765104.1 UDP-N-acetylglu